ncbi:MAG: hypothetical protein WBA74_26030, partial [Cyclobacteriaceae bacterium]
KDLTAGFESFEGFALSLSDESLESLLALKKQNLQTQDLVSTIQDKIASLPELGFNSDEETEDIKQLSKDGLELKSPYEGSFVIWDYADFVDKTIRIYENEIIDYRKMLVDENNKFEKMLKTIQNALIPAESPNVSEELLKKTEKVDPENIAMSILKYKSALVKYRLIDLNLAEDQTHIYNMLDKYDTLNKVVGQAAIHFEDFSEMNTPLEKKKYTGFLKKALGRVSLLNQYIKDQEVWVKNRKYFIGTRTAELKETVRWGVSPSDSVAVFTEPEGQLANRRTNYVVSDTVNFFVSAGFETEKTPYAAFIGRVDPGMNLLWKYDMPTAMAVADSLDSREYFQMVPGKPDLVTIYFSEDQSTYHFRAFDKRSGDVKWKAKIVSKKPFFDIQYNDLTRETVIFLDDPENPESGKDVEYIVIDKFGKVRK